MGTSGLEFADVYNRFHEKLNRYLERMVGKNDAEDLTQEVFLKPESVKSRPCILW